MNSADEILPSTEYIAFEREVLHDNIALCDQKAGVLLALSAFIVVFCLQSLPIPSNVQAALGPTWAATELGLESFGIAGFTFAAYLSLYVIAPRFLGVTRDHIFWNSQLFKLPLDKFLPRLAEVGEKALTRDMALHLHSLSQVCRTKYRYLGWAIYVGQLSFIAIVLAEVLRIFA